MTLLAMLMRQPILQFLAGGALLFMAYGLLDGRDGGTERDAVRMQVQEKRIVVTRGQAESLAHGFATRWRRPPSEEELAGIVAEYVGEEALVREALSLGLDQSDAVIRRQLRLKMEFLAQDAGSLGETTDEALSALLERLVDRFLMLARISFRHVFLDSGHRGEAAAQAEAGRLLEALQGQDGEVLAEGAGDRFLLGYTFRELPTLEIGRNFGGDVAAALEEALVGRWIGPVPSAYGLHLLRVETRDKARLPPLDEIRPALRAEWAAQRRREALDVFVVGLVSRCAITVEGAAGSTVAARR